MTKNINFDTTNSEQLWGCSIKPYFYPFSTNKEEDIYTRLLPFVPPEIRKKLTVFCSEKDRRNFGFKDIIAQPDCVFKHLNYYIVLEYKSLANSNQKHEKSKWKNQIRLKDVLQAIIATMQVSAVQKSPAVCVLRYVNSSYVISPSKEICDYILQIAPSAKKFKNEHKYISASVLAELIEPDIRKKYLESSVGEKGKQLHDKILG